MWWINRSYYRCTNPRCSAKKQVERSNEDPDTLIITYEGLHLHFAYPYLFMGQPQDSLPPIKKPKTTFSQAQAQESPHAHETQQAQDQAQEMGSQGLLEDMVPLIIRKPSTTNHSAVSNSNFSSCSSYHCPPASPPSLSWSSSNYSYAVGLDTSI